jgi:hypothetical protein
MKVIALLTLSLAAVVCEQQTLFAPHYVGFELRAPVPTGRRNALRPAARVNRSTPVNSSYAAAAPPRNDVFPGVNRLVPLAGSRNGVISAATEFVKNDVWVVDTGGGLTGNGLQPTPDPSMNLPEPTPVEPSAVRPIDGGCPPCDWEILFGIGGSADPGGDDV